MTLNKLEKEKQSLLEWIRKIKENNSNEEENYHMIEVIKEKIKDIEEEIEKRKK